MQPGGMGTFDEQLPTVVVGDSGQRGFDGTHDLDLMLMIAIRCEQFLSGGSQCPGVVSRLVGIPAGNADGDHAGKGRIAQGLAETDFLIEKKSRNLDAWRPRC